MFYNYYSRIQYYPQPQPQPLVVPRKSVIPSNMQQMRETIQMGVLQNQMMKASSILETGQRNIKRNTHYRQRQQPQQATNLEELYLCYEDGCIYRGQGVPPSNRQGLGVLYNTANREVYSGEWGNNQYEGFGILINQNPTKLTQKVDPRNLNVIEDGWKEYRGYFKSNKMHGEGILYLTNGQRFEGHFENGMIHGTGKVVDHNCKLIYGCWKEGFMIL